MRINKKCMNGSKVNSAGLGGFCLLVEFHQEGSASLVIFVLHKNYLNPQFTQIPFENFYIMSSLRGRTTPSFPAVQEHLIC